MNEIEKRIENPRYVIFSDDINWVKEHMEFPENSLNDHKVVVAPKVWNLKNDNRDIYEEDFILI